MKIIETQYIKAGRRPCNPTGPTGQESWLYHTDCHESFAVRQLDGTGEWRISLSPRASDQTETGVSPSAQTLVKHAGEGSISFSVMGVDTFKGSVDGPLQPKNPAFQKANTFQQRMTWSIILVFRRITNGSAASGRLMLKRAGQNVNVTRQKSGKSDEEAK